VGALALTGISGPAAAQDRPPAARQALVDLANVLGQSHAIRQACSKRKDFSWFRRMEQLLQVEAADQSLKNRLVRSFNDGYAAGQAGYPACGKDSQAAAVRLAQRGEALAGLLGQ
jgi:uncharacterized protein (TIGR02301 family)